MAATKQRPLKISVELGGFTPVRAWVRIRSHNGHILFSSEVFWSKQNAVRAAKSIHARIPNSLLVLPK